MYAACDQRDEFRREAGFGASIVLPKCSHVRQVGGNSDAPGDGGLQGKVCGKEGEG